MARYNRGMALRPVHRIKHVVDFTATLAKNTALNQNIIQSVDAPVLANTTEVETGSKVNGIFLVVEVASNETEVVGAIPNVYMAVRKNPGGNIASFLPNLVGSNDNKRWVIHQEMIMIENSKGGNPRTLYKGVIVLPRSYKRFGPDDKLQVSILCPAIDIALCGQVHYKEFR